MSISPTGTEEGPAALDVSVATLQRLTLCGAANVIGYALSAEDRKRASHEASSRDAGVSFVPLIFESLGVLTLSGLGRKTLYFIWPTDCWVYAWLSSPAPNLDQQMSISLTGTEEGPLPLMSL